MTHQWTELLSDYLDQELPENERVALEAHLQECAECSALLAELRRVVARAQNLENGAPPQDLWPIIARRIGATPSRSAVVDLASRQRQKRRWAFSLPQLAAAGIALMTLSGGTVWMLSRPERSGTLAARETLHPRRPAPREPQVVPAGLKPSASQSYAAAVADLERVLAEGRGKLDTTTVRVIEQNLAAIDRAIAEAQRALDADSANLYLNTHLAETMRRKLDLLRQAASLVRVS
jgi:predicted anti-sigma-YlaC factor YlaD